jgi:hypothetical protein
VNERRSLRFLLALFATAPLASADLVTGRIVGPSGAGVPGVDIDAVRVSNGNEEDNLENDGTSATGDFSTTIPPGVYDLYFFPPVPPTTTHLPLVVRNVVITGTRNLGTLQLAPGIALSGRIQTQSGAPVGGVTLEVVDESTGAVVPLANDRSNAFGNFNLAVPAGMLELRLDATSVLTPVLASRRLALAPAASTNLGNITLPPGFTVTGHVQRSADATAVGGVDLDLVDVATGEKLFLPHDNTSALGDFSVVVPAGTYDVELCAPFASRLVGKVLRNQVVSTSLALGTIALAPGFVLSGTIRSFSGTLQAGADVDVRSAGASVLTCSDNSNASGAYAVIVPAGTLKVTLHPPSFTLSLGSDVHKNVLVSADLTLDGTLPFCAPAANYGAGLAGTGGVVPHLAVSGGTPVAGNDAFAYELQSGRGGAQAYLMISLAPHSQALLGGTLLVLPGPCCSAFYPVTLGGAAGAAGAGNLRFPLPFPIDLAAGVNLYAQFFVQDPAAPQGWAFSDAVQFRVCR